MNALPLGGSLPLRLRFYSGRTQFLTAVTALALNFALMANVPVAADPARFWISMSNIATSGPEAPSVPGIAGTNRVLHIWAQPATVNAGAFHALNNPFKQLEGITLNLVTSATPVQFLSGSIVVYNPSLGGNDVRFDSIYSSAEGLTPTVGNPITYSNEGVYGIYDIEGAKISGATNVLGIGGAACHANDAFCTTTSNGSPAWLFGTVATNTGLDNGSTEYRLQVGRHGIKHAGVGETSLLTSVVFGTGTSPVYNGRNDREVTLGGDLPDFTLVAMPPSAVTETHSSASSGLWSQIVGGNPPSFLDNVVLDSGLITLTGAQQANKTTVNGGRLQINAGGSLASDVIVGASGFISGSGWVGSKLTLDGKLAASSSGPLHVIGMADLTGSSLTLAPGYTQSATVSDPFIVLVAEAGLQGQFSTLPTQSLGAGFSLESIVYGPKSVTIQVRAAALIGDHNGDLTVDAADYVTWRKLMDTSGGTTNPNYIAWKSHFGESLSGAGGEARTSTSVPEPGTLLLIALMVAIGRVMISDRYRAV